MITALDTNVLFDILQPDPRFGPASRSAMQRCLDEGALLISDVVWAETVAGFPHSRDGTSALAELGATFSPLTAAAAEAAGVAWRRYRTSGGSRDRVVADFLIGAHATLQADRLLTRDRGFYRRYFTNLTVLDPDPT